MITLLQGDCRELLKTLPDKSVQVCVTSPPYYGLRDYQVEGQIGLEATPALYVTALVEIFRDVRRVLRDDGTLWLNLGDSYSANGNRSGEGETRALSSENFHGGTAHLEQRRVTGNSGLAPKNLLGIPWRVAFALQDDGWYLRSDIIWSKPNCMPESVTDRPTRSHEYVFLLAKSARYYYDADAIREPHARLWDAETNGGSLCGTDNRDKAVIGGHGRAERQKSEPNPAGRNKRTVWTLPTTPYPGSHYAVMPEKLVEICLLAGSSAQACETCGAAWGRVVEREVMPRPTSGPNRGGASHAHAALKGYSETSALRAATMSALTTIGFAPRCSCGTYTCDVCGVVVPYPKGTNVPKGNDHATQRQGSSEGVPEEVDEGAVPEGRGIQGAIEGEKIHLPANLRDVREGVHGKIEDGPILQPDMFSQVDEHGSTGQAISEGIGTEDSVQEKLQPVEQRQPDTEQDQEDDPWICSGVSTRSPECSEVRIHNGTSVSDERDTWTTAPREGESSSHQWSENGQPPRELEDDQGRSSPRTCDLPPLRDGIPHSLNCPNCNRPMQFKRAAGSAQSVVLDPFGGSGTVAKVAERLQRSAILIELNQTYIELQEKRTDGVQVEMFT
jgi:DNA modification methylase